MEKILVAGAGGFIGHHLVRFLKKKGYWVRGADIKYPEFSPKDEADEFLILDLRDFRNCSEAVKGIDKVYQLAANMGGIKFITSVKADVVRDNILINTNMAEVCRLVGVKRLFFSSSACIYPKYKQEQTNVTPLKESDAYPADCEDGYGWEKLISERMYKNFYEDYGLEVRISRYHNIYGPEGTYDGGREKAPAALSRKIALASNPGEIEIWGDGCFPAGEQIISNPKIKCIEDFKINDTVLGVKGFQRVTNVFTRDYDGDLFSIKPEGMMPFKVTAEHPILVFRLKTFCKSHAPHWCKPNCFCHRHDCRHNIETWKGWVKPGDIVKDRGRHKDYLCVPKLKEEKKVEVDLRPFTLKGHGDGRPQEQASIPIIEIDEDWAWILGLYLAEGYSYNKKVSWCLGSHEEELREELHKRLTKLGLNYWEDNKKSTPWSKETHVANGPLSRWLKENFGSSAREKRIPSTFFSLPKEETREFINGYFKGDATSESLYASKRWKATSTSKDILVGTQILLAKIGNFGTIMWLNNWAGRGRSCGTLTYAEKPINVHWFQDEEFIYVPIRDIIKSNFKGNVYNLETEDHTYCLPATVHNCQTRSFCYIDDCLEGTFRLMESDHKEPLNIGSDRLITIDELVDMIAKIAGKDITKKHLLDKPQGVRGRNSDNTLCKKVLGWEPKISLEDGLEKTYKWIEEQAKKVKRI